MHENHYVAFIDILGFKEIIDFVYKGNDDKFNDITNAIDVATKLAFHFQQKNINTLKYRLFSDCLCVSVKCEDDKEKDLYNLFLLLVMISYYQYFLLDEGILTRGAVTIGKHYIDENIIFSEGLVKAHEIEQTIALHPRIVVDIEIINKILSNQHTYIEDTRIYLKKLIIQDWDEYYFVNSYFFHTILNKIKEGGFPIQESDQESQAYINQKLNIQNTDLTNVNYSEINTNDILNKHKEIFLSKLHTFERNNSKVVTKYLWSLNFIDWNITGKSNIDFSEIDIPTINEMLAKKKELDNKT